MVAFVFQQYLASKSMPHVAFLLGLSHVSPPRGGNSWTPSSVRTDLTHPLYVGEYAVAGYREHLKELRIITTEDFDMVQKTLGRYREGHEKRPQMPTERKASMLNKMAAKYEAYLSATVAPRARS